MEMVIISGFLGAGKTSVMLRLVEQLNQANGIRIAVIENDFGKMGIDGEVMRKYGLDVRDLKGGCICCTLSANLVDTLRLLGANMDPDMVMVEPTGVADPEYILLAVKEYTGPPITKTRLLVVLDAERFLKIKRMFERPLKNHLRTANAVVINKADLVEDAVLEGIEAEIRGMGFDGKVIRASAESGDNMDKLAEVVRE